MVDIRKGRVREEMQPSAQEELHRGLKDRHVQMIAIGGTIGVGLFLGSATAIQRAGPGLVVSYAMGGLVMFLIMRAPLGSCFFINQCLDLSPPTQKSSSGPGRDS
jgi:amino acid transporter, AAT family